MKVNFHNVGSKRSSFSINTHQLNSDILIRAVKRLGSVKSNAISIAYDEKKQKGTVIDELSLSSVGQFNVVINQ